MKKSLPFCKEFSIFCIEDRVTVDRVVRERKSSSY